MRFDAVIFDIDNVLVDTRASYTDCIRKTVETYLETVLKFQPSRSTLLSRREIELFKSLGGFNDDWDTCYGLLLYALHLKPKKHSINELHKKMDIIRLAKTLQARRLPPTFFPTPLARGEERRGVGVKGAEKLWGKHPKVSFKKIADIFQRFYLSDFVWNEKLLIPKSFLKSLKRLGLKIGIVTGRNQEEAGFALRRFQIDTLMDAMITTDDTPKGLKKPNPYGLLKVASQLGRNLHYLYVGDLPDDILAAKRARKKIRIASCGYLAASAAPQEMKRELKKAGTDFVCREPRELRRVIQPTRRLP